MHLLLKQFSKALNNPAEAKTGAISKTQQSSIKPNKRSAQLVRKIHIYTALPGAHVGEVILVRPIIVYLS